MRKYVYKNATVYITEPTEEQKENIRRSTERFIRRLVEKGLMPSDEKRDNKRVSGASSNARKRDRRVKR